MILNDLSFDIKKEGFASIFRDLEGLEAKIKYLLKQNFFYQL